MELVSRSRSQNSGSAQVCAPLGQSLIGGWCCACVAVILIGAVVSFPVGLDSKLAQHYCPGARIYSAGACQVGWAYMLGIMSAALVVFCPVLSHYTDIDDDLDEAEDSEVVAGSSTVRLIA